MEAVGLPLLMSGVGALFTELNSLIAAKKHNAGVVNEIDQFKRSLEVDLRVAENKLKTFNDDQSWAIESLSKDLVKASKYLENCREKGWFRGYWDAKKISSELAALRKELSHRFYVTLFFTNLEVNIEKEKRTEDFHSKLVELSTLSATRSTDEIKCLLKPLTAGLKVNEVRFQQLHAEIKALSESLGSEDHSSLDTEKFLNDILACLGDPVPSVNASEDETQYYDPITDELMCDPVKCGDGKTYDRFTVFKCNADPKHEPLDIRCPDESLRIRLDDKFRLEKPDIIRRSRRNEYRTEALDIASADDFGEALVRLENVLQWNPKDDEICHARDNMRDLYRKEALNLSENGNYEEALDMLLTVQKWSPSDREIFDKLELIERQRSTSTEDLRPQPCTNEAVKSEVQPATENLPGAIPKDGRTGIIGDKESSAKASIYRQSDGSLFLRGASNSDRQIPPELAAPLIIDMTHVNKEIELQKDQRARKLELEREARMRELKAATHSIWGLREKNLWWQVRCCRYLACILCRCRPCCCSERLFGPTVHKHFPHLRCTCLLLSPIVTGVFCLDWILSCNCFLGDEDLPLDSCLESKYNARVKRWLLTGSSD